MSHETEEHIRMIGKKATFFDTKGVQWSVYIKSFKHAYGRVDYLISPADGQGERWVSSDRIDIQ